jgi:hypothetical protein
MQNLFNEQVFEKNTQYFPLNPFNRINRGS